jgi:hypothetical protein
VEANPTACIRYTKRKVKNKDEKVRTGILTATRTLCEIVIGISRYFLYDSTYVEPLSNPLDIFTYGFKALGIPAKRYRYARKGSETGSQYGKWAGRLGI